MRWSSPGKIEGQSAECVEKKIQMGNDCEGKLHFATCQLSRVYHRSNRVACV